MRRQKNTGGMKPLTITVTPELRATLDSLAEQSGRSVSAVVVEHLSRAAESQGNARLAAVASAMRAVGDARDALGDTTVEGLDEQAVRAAVRAATVSGLVRAIDSALSFWVASGGGSAVDQYDQARSNLLDAVAQGAGGVMAGLQARDRASKVLPDAARLATGDLDALALGELAAGVGAEDPQIEALLIAAADVLEAAKRLTAG